MNSLVNIEITEPKTICKKRNFFCDFGQFEKEIEEKKDCLEKPIDRYMTVILVKPKQELEYGIAIDDIFNRLKNIVPNITDEAEKRLLEEQDLLKSVFTVVSNLNSILNKEFSIVGINVDDAPDIEPPYPILILIHIKYDEYKKISKVKDRIYNVAYLNIDRKYRGDMYIINTR